MEWDIGVKLFYQHLSEVSNFKNFIISTNAKHSNTHGDLTDVAAGLYLLRLLTNQTPLSYYNRRKNSVSIKVSLYGLQLYQFFTRVNKLYAKARRLRIRTNSIISKFTMNCYLTKRLNYTVLMNEITTILKHMKLAQELVDWTHSIKLVLYHNDSFHSYTIHSKILLLLLTGIKLPKESD